MKNSNRLKHSHSRFLLSIKQKHKILHPQPKHSNTLRISSLDQHSRIPQKPRHPSTIKRYKQTIENKIKRFFHHAQKAQQTDQTARYLIQF